MKVEIVNIGKNPTPKYAHDGDSGFDLQADFSNTTDEKLLKNLNGDEYTLNPGCYAAIPTGIKISLSEPGYELQVRGRSGLAAKKGIIAHFGTVDYGYRGEIHAILYNFSSEPFKIKQGDKIAQGVITKWEKALFVEVDELEKTDRNENKFGSTGI